MLSNDLRLKGKHNFFEVRNKGILFQGVHVGISKLGQKIEEKTKVGVVVSTKISKKAVVRNRIRRAIYDAARDFYTNLPTAHNLVIMAKKSAVNETFDSIKSDVLKVLSKIK